MIGSDSKADANARTVSALLPHDLHGCPTADRLCDQFAETGRLSAAAGMPPPLDLESQAARRLFQVRPVQSSPGARQPTRPEPRTETIVVSMTDEPRG